MSKPVINKTLINKTLQSLSGYLLSHGGGIKLISWESKSGLVKVKLLGACSNCGLRHLTVKMWLEKEMIKKLPAIKQVVVEEK